jgi:predicted glycoside hydrolase/deacetylase ChbG (UPF0249 family)
MIKPLILCADDYAYNEAVSSGILTLLQQGRLNATSCMTDRPRWRKDADRLTDIPSHCQLGLHINLTEGALDYDLKQLLIQSYLGRVDKTKIRTHIEKQWDAFEQQLQRSPDFIDGHQHVHQFPHIRDIVLDLYQQRAKKNCWVRLSANPLRHCIKSPFAAKQFILYSTGYLALRHRLLQNKIPHNPAFSGVYDFNEKSNYRLLFQRFLQQLSQGGLIMCHPALAQQGSEDVIANARFNEFQYLHGNDFLNDLKNYGLQLATSGCTSGGLPD